VSTVERTHAWESERRATDTRPIETRRILGRGDLWVWEARLVGTDEVVHVVSILELAGDHIARVTEFFSHPLEADGV
jgi:hypothetical protein